MFGQQTHDSKCPYCHQSGHQYFACPKVKSIEMYPNGTVKRVEFHRDYELEDIPMTESKSVEIDLLESF